VSAAPRPRFEQRGALAWGTAWAVGFGLIEVIAVSPLQEGGLLEHVVWWLIYWLMPYWCVVGFLLVRLADRRERMGGKPGLIAAFMAIVLVAAAAQPPLVMGLTMFSRHAFPKFDVYAPHALAIAPSLDTWGNIGLYNVWITLFYGGLLLAARIFATRAEHVRALLYSSAMTRSRSAALLDAERLRTLQTQIDPRLLLDSMQELERRYRVAPERAERLLEALVDFLRVAMHGLRIPVSTVAAELKLARAFAQLQSERGLRGAWRVVEDPPPDAGRIDMSSQRFPSLLMLPLLALGGETGRPVLRAQTGSGRTVISLHGLAAQIPADLKQQIQARLRVLYGENFILDGGSPAGQGLAITLQEPITSGGANLETITPR
jgi:signal transduction histidine kinase